MDLIQTDDSQQHPFPGLMPFTEAQHVYFYGRAQVTHRVLDQLRDKGAVTLTGPAGCGKSSLLRSIMSDIRMLAIDEAPLSFIVTRPGSHPTRSLAHALVQHPDVPGLFPDCTLETVEAAIRTDITYVARLLEKVHEKSRSKVILVIDQFEELFAGGLEMGDITAYVRQIEACHDLKQFLLIATDSGVMAKLAYHRDVIELIDATQVTLPPLTDAEFSEAIEEPMVRAARLRSRRDANSWNWEPEIDKGLFEAVLSDRTHDWDELGLLQHCLRQVWQRAIDRCCKNGVDTDGTACVTVTAEDYFACGGIPGSVQQHCEGAYRVLGPKEKELVKSIFLTLTKKQPDGSITRRSATVSQVSEHCRVLASHIVALVSSFAGGQALKIEEDCSGEADAAIVNVTHSAVTTYWERLVEWHRPAIDREIFPSAEQRSPIFISYRRADTGATARLLYERLSARHGPRVAFFDVDSIPYGVDYRRFVKAHIAQCDLVILLIGPTWLDSRVNTGIRRGRRRLDDPLDLVRVEIETALELGVTVIPVLVDGVSSIPSPLPTALSHLVNLNAMILDNGSKLSDQTEGLLEVIGTFIPKAGSDFGQLNRTTRRP